MKPTIKVRRQKGPGFWAVIYGLGKGPIPVQSPGVYGFETAREAREAAKKQIAGK